MAKGKKKTTAHVYFASMANPFTIPDVVCTRVTQKPHSLRFLHLEKKGDTWLLLDGLGSDKGTPWSDKMRFNQAVGLEQEVVGAVVHIRQEPRKISKHIALSLKGISKEFYYLDELPDGTWRIAYTEQFLRCPHSSIFSINITEAGAC